MVWSSDLPLAAHLPVRSSDPALWLRIVGSRFSVPSSLVADDDFKVT
jgi:hypothetical protein